MDNPKTMYQNDLQNERGTDPRYNARRRLFLRWRLFAGIGVIVILGLGIYLYVRPSDPEKIKARETAKLVEEIGDLMFLPEGETPTIATVTDPEKLKDQPFFKNALLEDKVIIYVQARKVILYRPAENKIVEISSLSTDKK